MALSTFGVQAAIKAGYLKAHPALGSFPKLLGAGTVAYFVGRISYVSECVERLKRLPNSPLAQRLNAASSGYETEFAPDNRLNHFERVDKPAPGPRQPTETHTDDFSQGLYSHEILSP